MSELSPAPAATAPHKTLTALPSSPLILQARLNQQAATIGELQAKLASAEQAQQGAERRAGQLLRELEEQAKSAHEHETRLRCVCLAVVVLLPGAREAG